MASSALAARGGDTELTFWPPSIADDDAMSKLPDELAHMLLKTLTRRMPHRDACRQLCM